jgi:hypothetical protein
MNDMRYRVDIDFIGMGNAGSAYGGHLDAWSFRDIDGQVWFEAFRQEALGAIRTRYLPVYRMADGEYRFMFGRRINWSRQPLLLEFLAVGAEKLRFKNPDRWKTSWGETYEPQQTHVLREQLIQHVRFLSETGYLACYINDNGLNAFVQYNTDLQGLMLDRNIQFSERNYIPFHFAPSLLISKRWQDFIQGRKLLIVTGLTPEKETLIRNTLILYGAETVDMLPMSSQSSLSDTLDLSGVDDDIDIVLVAAGIGSANILRQLRPLETLCLDIGGLMNCFVNRDARQHGGVIRLPPHRNP